MTIEVRGVSKRFGRTVAVDQVSFTLQDGVIYGLLGNNGAGKTTLLGMIANRLYPDAGQIVVDGEPVADNDRVLGLMVLMGNQDMHPDGTRVGKAIDLGARFYPHFDKEYALDLARQFDLDSKAKIKSLSTGYATILRDIIALAANTPYVLLDEPVLGLDAQNRSLLYKQIIARYAESPCTIVISTHLIAEVSNLIEHTLIIDHGRIVQDTPTQQLLSGARMLAGPRGAVEQAAASLQVLSRTNVGGLATMCVKVPDGGLDTAVLPAGVEASPVNLQDYFIATVGRDSESANKEETR